MSVIKKELVNWFNDVSRNVGYGVIGAVTVGGAVNTFVLDDVDRDTARNFIAYAAMTDNLRDYLQVKEVTEQWEGQLPTSLHYKGDILKGRNSVRHGFGATTHPVTKDYYVGNYVLNDREGEGALVMRVECPDGGNGRQTLSGEWKQNDFISGTMTYCENSYEGDVISVDGCYLPQDEHALFTYPDGSVFEARWENGYAYDIQSIGATNIEVVPCDELKGGDPAGKEGVFPDFDGSRRDESGKFLCGPRLAEEEQGGDPYASYHLAHNL